MEKEGVRRVREGCQEQVVYTSPPVRFHLRLCAAIVEPPSPAVIGPGAGLRHDSQGHSLVLM